MPRLLHHISVRYQTPVEEELILAVFDTIKYKYEQF